MTNGISEGAQHNLLQEGGTQNFPENNEIPLHSTKCSEGMWQLELLETTVGGHELVQPV